MKVKYVLFSIMLLAISNSAVAQTTDTLQKYNELQKMRDTIKLNNQYSYKSLLNYKKLVNSNDLNPKAFKGHDAAEKEYKQLKRQLIKDNADYRYITVDSSIYGEMQRVWKAHQAINYGTPGGYIAPLGTRRVKMREGEGVKNFYLLEANLDHRYTLSMGRPHAAAWSRRTRTTFDYKVNFRMTRDESSPIVPYSNDVGLSVESTIWDSFRGNIIQDKERFNFVTYDSLLKLGHKTHKFITTLIQLHHYSNGQEPGSTYTEPVTLLTRNDYKKGDFSTNYLRARLTWSRVNLANHSLLSLGLGFRRDMGSDDGTFVYTPAQDSSYGKQRLEYQAIWYSRVFTTRALLKDRKNKWQLHMRAEGDIILDKNLQKFIPNLEANTGKYRMGTNFFTELRPLSHRTIGYVFHFYLGRDYMNIRYDDIIWSASIGLSFSLDKYFPSGWTPEAKIPLLRKLLR